MELSWPDLLIAFAVCHMAGDYLLQTDWQANGKTGGLGTTGEPRRALLTHVATYTLAFAPVVAWLAAEQGPWVAAAGVLAVAIPHAVVDDGGIVRWWVRRVKRVEGPAERRLHAPVDQTLHAVSLWAAALVLSA